MRVTGKSGKRERKAKKPEPERFCIGTPRQEPTAERRQFEAGSGDAAESSCWSTLMSLRSAASSLPLVPPIPAKVDQQKRQQGRDAIMGDLARHGVPKERLEQETEELILVVQYLQAGDMIW